MIVRYNYLYSDSFWRLFSLVHVFLSPLKFPMGNPTNTNAFKTKNGTISISRHIYKGTDRIHSKSDR